MKTTKSLPQYTQLPMQKLLSLNYPIRASYYPLNEPAEDRPSGNCAFMDFINEYRRIMGILVVQVFSVRVLKTVYSKLWLIIFNFCLSSD